ncbi:hypothetical protein ACIP98_36640 [Streptomyces sp. NPDC088354]|uniref:hypothetical protein n=1 Tax=unclassified Streptomyces TaxID=2593676 RepID=UPI0029AA57F4|nr:hypothetical protein [Streptomyces sp. MI02-7b]MDX3076261.1 hypothetical protein [Streptomyces sp. MI02-7b]
MTTTTLDGATLEKLISAAVAAPSCQARRPWRCRLDPDTATLQVRAVGEPRTPRGDGDQASRALYVSIGAALFNLRVAVTHFGWEPQVRLLPSPADPGLYASVRLTAPAHARAPETRGADLYGALWRRPDAVATCPVRRPPGAFVLDLVDAAHSEGAALSLPHAAETRRLLRLTEDADRRGAVDGEPVPPPTGPGGESSYGPGPAPGDDRFPLVAVLTTPRDGRADWLRAGQALQHVLLAASAQRVRASLLHQALDYPDLRRALRSAESGPGHVQMLVRLGYGPLRAGTAPRGPRHPVIEVN